MATSDGAPAADLRDSAPRPAPPFRLSRLSPGALRPGPVPKGLAHCFRKNDEGKLEELQVLEPVAATSLECMHVGAPTSFSAVTGTTLGEARKMDPDAFPEAFRVAGFCEEFEARAEAAARTWARPHARDELMGIVPLGDVKKDFNFSTERPRVLNVVNVVSDDDNIKQDKSIDVYDRFDEDGEKKEN